MKPRFKLMQSVAKESTFDYTTCCLCGQLEKKTERKHTKVLIADVQQD